MSLLIIGLVTWWLHVATRLFPTTWCLIPAEDGSMIIGEGLWSARGGIVARRHDPISFGQPTDALLLHMIWADLPHAKFRPLWWRLGGWEDPELFFGSTMAQRVVGNISHHICWWLADERMGFPILVRWDGWRNGYLQAFASYPMCKGFLPRCGKKIIYFLLSTNLVRGMKALRVGDEFILLSDESKNIGCSLHCLDQQVAVMFQRIALVKCAS